MKSTIVCLAGFLLTTAASAQETGGCGKFRWPIEEERILLTSPSLSSEQSGVSFKGGGRVALLLRLSATPEAKLPYPPERAGKSPQAFAGHVALAELPAGAYQVTLSDNAWIDAVAAGTYLKPTAFSGVADCAGVRKSVRFDIRSSGIVLQFSDAPRDHLAIVVRRIGD